MTKDPYKNSPYDAAGMPLGAETVDYDNKEDVAQKTVKDKYVAPLPLFSDDDDFQEEKIERTKFNPALNNTAIQFPGHRVHKKHEEDLGTGIPELKDMPKQVDLDNPEVHEELAKEDPKQTNTTKLEGDKVEHDEDKRTDTEKEADKNAEESRKESDNSNPDDAADLLKLLKDTDNDGK